VPVEYRQLHADHREALEAFAARIPHEERMFVDRTLLSASAVARWTREFSAHRMVALDDGEVVGLVTVAPGMGWQSHVGEFRLIVQPDRRSHGIGRRLAEHGLELAAEHDLRKLSTEVMAVGSGGRMLESLGFVEEARLRGHVQDGKGELQDLVIMSYWLPEPSP